MRIVGLTGGEASGKSLVLQIFMNLGAYGIDCDVLSREAVIPCSKAWWEIVRFFGTEILKHDLELDRKRLRDVVFNDAQKRKVLEKIIHPEVKKKCKERIEALKKLGIAPDALVVIDVPLLIETGVQEEFDEVVVVHVSEETQIRRLVERDGMTREEAKKMIAIQMPLEEKLRFADFVISNEGPREETENQVRALFATLSAHKNT
jgi:dephospho-CoA kinase